MKIMDAILTPEKKLRKPKYKTVRIDKSVCMNRYLHIIILPHLLIATTLRICTQYLETILFLFQYLENIFGGHLYLSI
jgi:hypothetical protein